MSVTIEMETSRLAWLIHKQAEETAEQYGEVANHQLGNVVDLIDKATSYENAVSDVLAYAVYVAGLGTYNPLAEVEEDGA